MALLAELPTEILLLVLSYLPPADKATLSCVCKLLQGLAEPMLYADIHLKSRGPTTNAYHLHLLLLKLLPDPELASCVKRFQTIGWRNRRSPQSPRRNRLRDSKFEIISDIARNAVNEAGDARNGHSQTLIISRLPNLVELCIGYDITSNFEPLGNMFRNALCSEKAVDGQSKFRHLKRVDLCVDMTRKDCSAPQRRVKHRLPDFLPYFYLPSVEDLRMLTPHDQENFTWPATPPCTQSLTSLSLQRSSASEALLARILAVTPNLKCLEYRFICEENSRRGPTSLCAEGLGEALAHVKATLEQLTISVHFYRCHYYPFADFPSRYDIKGRLSLHDYESLVMLEVPAAMLLGYRPTRQIRLEGQLPPRIRQLYLTNDSARYAGVWKSRIILQILRDHLSQYREQTADLETLGLQLDWDDKSLDDFRMFCDGVHLTLKLI